MAFLNAEKFIEEAIESVFAQSYERWELLLVDDGSTDGSTDIALRYAERYPEKVRYLEHPGHENRGASASRNLGISRAKGEYIAFLDSDDVWLAQKLERQVAILNSHPGAGMVYGLSQYFHICTEGPEGVQRDFVPELGVEANRLYKPPTLLTLLHPLGEASAPPPSDILLRRAAIKRVGGFEEAFTGMYQLYEDQTFLIKVYLKESVLAVNECWDRYRLHPDSCSAIVEKAGQYSAVRLYFLNWLARYLAQEGVKDPQIWMRLQGALRPYGKSSTLAKVVEIVDVCLSATDSNSLWGHNIESPEVGNSIDGYALHIAGWVLGKSSPVVAVEVVHEGNVVKRVPITIQRPDIEVAFPQVAGAAYSGFRTTVSLMGMTEPELQVQAVLQDQQRVALGAIHARFR
jgi:glycosyltransferase involved in cell wall biosynthesis